MGAGGGSKLFGRDIDCVWERGVRARELATDRERGRERDTEREREREREIERERGREGAFVSINGV